MKAKLGIVLVALALSACNSHQKEQMDKMAALRAQDSTMAVEAKSKDSLITTYVNTMGDIQNNLDSLKIKEHILSMNSPESKSESKSAIMSDISAIDQAIIDDNKKVAELQSRLRKMQGHDARLKKTIDNLNREIAQKDSEIATLQGSLHVANDSIAALSQRLNDSVAEIRRARAAISQMTDQMNTVWYVVGTMRQLKDKGAITKSGGVLGIGRLSELAPQIRKSAFTQGDKTQITEIPLNGKFSKMITSHPASSYKINRVGKKDNLTITDQQAFWSESKYLVVEIR